MRDFLELSYKRFSIPVKSGERFGEVYGFLQNSRPEDDQNEYTSLLKFAIERQKYCDSKKAGYDVGAAVATANIFENGTYKCILRRLRKKNNFIPKGCEKAIRVEEDGDTYHVLFADSPDNLVSLRNEEQRGIIAYSIWKQLMKDPDIDRQKMKSQWVTAENFKNCKMFGKLLEDPSVKVKVMDGPRIYEKCLIYRNLCERATNEFQLDKEEIKNASSLELAVATA